MLSLPPIPNNLPAKIQDLPPKWAHFALHMLKFVEDELGINLAGKGVLVAVSGGADSLCLLILLKALQKRLNLNLQVCHLDHGLRPSSAQEACWVEEVCKQLNLFCHVRRIDIAALAAKENLKMNSVSLNPENSCEAADIHVKGLENTGREARYTLFEKVRKAEKLDFIATAHTLNDLAEDICMRFLRGCGWPELGGMAGFDPKRFLIRPLLMQPRLKLEEMFVECGLSYLTDESNESMDYLRNRVRKQIVPMFTAENNGFLDHCRNLWSLARDDNKFWEHYLSQVDKKLVIPNNTENRELILPFSAFLKEDKAVRLRLYRHCLEKLAQNYHLLTTHTLKSRDDAEIKQDSAQIFTSASQVRELDNAVLRRVNGSGSGQMHIQFSGGASAQVGKAEIVFSLL